MNKKANVRIVSLVLALVMLLPLVSVPAFAEETEVTYVSHSESFDGKTLYETTLNHSLAPSGASVQAAAKDAEQHGDVFHMPATPKAPYEYYLVNTSARSASAIKEPVIGADGTLSGTADNGVTVSNAVINSDSFQTKADDTYYVATGDLADAYCGYVSGNISAPAKLLHPTVSGEGDFIAISFDLFLSEDFLSKQGVQGRAYVSTTDGKTTALELFCITAAKNGGGKAVFTRHGNATNVYDAGVKLALGEWHTIDYIVDRSSKVIYAYADGAFAYQILFPGAKIASVATPVVLLENTLAVENGRLGTPGVTGGFFEIDNLSVRATDEDGISEEIRRALTVEYDFDSQKLDLAVSSKPSGATLAGATADADKRGNVLHLDVTPKGAADYYLWQNNNNKWPITGTVSDGKITGTCTKGTITEAEIPTGDNDTSKKYTIGSTEYTIVTGAYADAIGGAGNYSTPVKFKTPAYDFGGDYLTVSFDIYLSADFHMQQGFAGRIIANSPTNTTSRVELFRLWMSGESVVFGQHNNAYNVTNTTAVLEKAAWHTLTFVIDRNTAVVSAYADGAFAYQTVAHKANEAFNQYVAGADMFPLSFQYYTFQVENNRGGGNVGNKGFVEIDNVKTTAEENVLKHATYSQTFEDQTLGYAPFEGFASLEAVNTTVMDNYGSKAWNIPQSGNSNKGPYLDTSYYTYATGKNLVFEADYFIEAGAAAQLQVQFQSFTALHDGALPTKNVSDSDTTQIPNNGGSWLDFYQIQYTGNGLATFKFENDYWAGNGGKEIAEAQILRQNYKLAAGRWHNISLVIDLEDGYYDVYINGNLTFESVPIYRNGKKLTNITVPADKIVIGKVNSSQAAYTGNIQLDNIRIHQGDAPTMGAENLNFYDFEDFKYSQGMDVAFTANNGKEPSLLTVGSVNGDTALRLPLIAAGSVDAWALLRSDGKAFLTGFVPDATDPAKGTLAGNAITLEADANGVYWYTDGTNKYKPVSEALAGTAVGDANNCKSVLLTHSAFSYKTAQKLLVEMDYFIEYGSDGTLEIQFEKYRSNGTEKSYLNLFKIKASTGEILDASNKACPVKMNVGQWNNIKLMIDLAAGTYDVYVNGAYSHAANAGSGVTNLEVGYSAASMISVAKIARELNSAKLNTGVIYIDDVRLAADFEADKTLATDMLLTAVNGASIRLKDADKTGLRFATLVNEAALAQIKAYLGAESVTVGNRGTLITPESYYLTANAMTHDALAALPVTTPYLDVAFGGNYFGGDAGVSLPEGNYMVGSIVNLKDYARSFAAVGYVELLIDGKSFYLYSDVVVRSAKNVASAALADNSIEWSDEHRAILSTFATGTASTVDPVREALSGLNVLAIGDSLFYGAYDTVDGEQWINLLGNKYGWNLTNLGIGGATITSKREGATYSNFSMYDALFTTDTFCFGSNADGRFYNCGVPSGNKADVDLILLQAGSNDYGATVSAPLGEIGSTNPEEFLGAWKLMVEKLLELYPNATVVMMTAWENRNQSREDGLEAIPYTTSVIDLYEALYAENSRVALIDSGDPEVSDVHMLDATFRALYSYDYYHLNDEGMKIMANNMIPYLVDVVNEYVAAE